MMLKFVLHYIALLFFLVVAIAVDSVFVRDPVGFFKTMIVYDQTGLFSIPVLKEVLLYLTIVSVNMGFFLLLWITILYHKGIILRRMDQ